MGTYASSSDIAARMPYRTIDADSEPSTTDVEGWITEATGKLHGSLKAAQISTPVTDSDGIQQMKAWVCAYAEGRVMIAYGGTGDEAERRAGQALVDAFEKLCTEIPDAPALYSAMLEGGAADDATRRVRSHVLDHPDGQSISAGDFAPGFVKKNHEDQF